MEPFSFITEVAGQKLPDPHELLIPVKADHVKLQEVIGMFSKKVDSLVDKQRHEYTQAYEYHMFDIQKELHRLREKAAQIANDTTRDEKLANLDKDQKWYRAEAMRLDMETNQMRRVLQALTGKITSAERERDWLLTKLREAKTILAELEVERADMGGSLGVDGEGSMASTESSYTLEMMSSRYLKKNAANLTDELPFTDPSNWKAKMNSGANFVSRKGQHTTLDKYMQGSGGNDATNNKKTTKIETNKLRVKEIDAEKEIRSELVIIRTRQEHCRNFIAHCGNSAASGPWSKRAGRSFDEILTDCVNVIENNYFEAQAKSDGDYNNLASRIESLAAELALCPATYYAISELFTVGNRVDEGHLESGKQPSPPTDITEQTVWEDVSNYEDGVVRNFQPEECAEASSFSLSGDIRRYLGDNA